MGKIKAVYIQLKRDHPGWSEKDLPYLFEQYVKNLDKPQINRKYFDTKACKPKK